MRGCKIMVAIAILAALMAFWPGTQANAQTLEFYQLDFDLDGTITQNSDWGAVDFTFTGSADILYFNLTIDGSWQIRNIPILSIEGVGITHTLSLWFDLGNEVGQDVTSLYYAYELTPDTLEYTPTDSTLASVSDRWIVFYGGADDDPIDPVPPPAGPMVGGMVGAKQVCVNKGVPNQECGKDECCPAAVSNSLQWLKTTHGLTMPPTDIATMKIATKWRVPPRKIGCYIWDNPNGNAWWKDKKKFMEDNGYPVTTEKFDANQIDQICAEMDRNQDVEMQVSGHTVTLVGMAKLKNGNWAIDYHDDIPQGIGNGGNVKKKSTYNPGTGKFIDGPLKGKTLHYFVVECPLPKPPGNNFGLFPTDALPFEGAEEAIYVVEYQAPSPDTGDWHDRNYNGILDSCDYVKVHWLRPSEDSCRYDWLHVVGKYIVNLDRIVDDGEDGIWTPCDSVYKHFKTPPYFCHTYRYHVERVGKWRGLWVVKQEYDPRVHEIPTLTEWSLIIFGVVLLGFITWMFLKRRKVIGVRA